MVDKADCLIGLNELAVEGRYAVLHDDLYDASGYIAILTELLDLVCQEIGRQE